MNVRDWHMPDRRSETSVCPKVYRWLGSFRNTCMIQLWHPWVDPVEKSIFGKRECFSQGSAESRAVASVRRLRIPRQSGVSLSISADAVLSKDADFSQHLPFSCRYHPFLLVGREAPEAGRACTKCLCFTPRCSRRLLRKSARHWCLVRSLITFFSDSFASVCHCCFSPHFRFHC